MTTDLREKARKIKLILTDSDGVLTDNGVYYSASGEEMKRFSVRDGMGVERLRNCHVEVGIVTGEMSPSVVKRAEKLQVVELHLGVKNKAAKLQEIMLRKQLRAEEIAFIGDDTNDVEVLQLVGLSACPADATEFAKRIVDYICVTNGGHGCFRELAELVIASQDLTLQFIEQHKYEDHK
jgi:3-deoxy-D-manno-octulosonate 8-phosphate phosphatase (KDO 8-P phosphatase)